MASPLFGTAIRAEYRIFSKEKENLEFDAEV